MTPDEPTPDLDALGLEMHRLIAEMYPICRSISGQGLRDTLDILARHIPLERRTVSSGTRVLDWTVPPEWNVRDAYVKNAAGERVIDFRQSNLHLVSYSIPVQARMTRDALDAHLFSSEEHPDWIPYRTSYYDRTWGFCLSHRQRLALPDGDYEVSIDASLAPGQLTYGECVLEGETSEEVLISTHVCHPSLCNDNLSGVALATFLARQLALRPRRYTYRFLFVPGTIGAIAWLAANEGRVARVRHGLVLTGVGDAGALTYKRSRRGDADVDRAMVYVLTQRGRPFAVQEFSPYGYDERQYCSPGFNLPVGCLMRTPHGRYPEYHTSADDLTFVRPESLSDSFAACLALLDVLEGNRRYLNLNPKGEPQLGRRGLYDTIGGAPDPKMRQMALLWVLSLSDGAHSLLDVAERSALPFAELHEAASQLVDCGLLRVLEADVTGVGT